MNFEEAYPQLMKYWDYKKNTKNPDEVHSGTRIYNVFFICDKNHSFTKLPAHIKHLSNEKINCPVCSGRNDYFSFEEKYPDILKYWDYKKNKDKPNEVSYKTKKEYFFKCEKNHSFKRSPQQIKKKVDKTKLDCLVCSGLLLTKDTRLDLKYPKISSEWDLDKNKLTPKEVSYLSDKKYWWKCENNHSWKAGISDRTGHRYKNKEGTKCPHCWQKTISRNELIIFSELHQFFNEVYSTYKVFNKHLDIFIKDINLAIEYDGYHWHKNKVYKDSERNAFLLNENIKTLRVREYPLSKIENQDIEYNNYEEDLFYVIIKILNFILNNYKLDKKIKNKIKCYLKNKKITNQYFFKEIEDSYRIKKIDNPVLFEDYDVKKNKLPLHYYGQGSSYKAWWKCASCKFEYKKSIIEKNKRPNCKNCKKIEEKLNPKEKKKKKYIYKPRIKKENKLLKIKNTHPEVLSELPKDKVEELKELNYTNTSVYFQSTCTKCDHTYKTNLWNKIHLKKGCPNCNFNIYKEKTTLLNDYPFLKKIYSPLNKIDLEYTDINYPRKLKWVCNKNHITEESLRKKTKNPSCKKCESCSIIADVPRVFDTWDLDKNKNNGIDPFKTTMGCKKKAHFKCKVAEDHCWEVPICNRVQYDCPFCSNQRLSITNRFDLNYPEISKMWSKNNKENPDQFISGSQKNKHLWDCNFCNKEFEKSIGQMIKTNGMCPNCQCYNVGEHKGINRRSIRKNKKPQ